MELGVLEFLPLFSKKPFIWNTVVNLHVEDGPEFLVMGGPGFSLHGPEQTAIKSGLSLSAILSLSLPLDTSMCKQTCYLKFHDWITSKCLELVQIWYGSSSWTSALHISQEMNSNSLRPLYPLNPPQNPLIFVLFWAVAPKGSMNYGKTQGRYHSLFLCFTALS